MVIAVVIVLVLVGAGAAFAIAWSHRGAKQASLSDAIAQFRRQGQGGGAGFLRPAVGVYTYRGRGTEQLSVLGTSQHWGPELPGTVSHTTDGCWTFRIEYSTHHRQDWDYCPHGTKLQETGGRTLQSFSFVATTLEDLEVFTCDPPADAIRTEAKPGEHWGQACEGHSSSRGTSVSSRGTNTFVGLANVRVEGTAIPTYHSRIVRHLSGSQHGIEKMDMWFSTRDGIPLRVARDIHVDTPSPIGAVKYTERGSFVLTSLEPRR